MSVWKLNCSKFQRCYYSSAPKAKTTSKSPRVAKMLCHLRAEPGSRSLIDFIPPKHLSVKTHSQPENLYLIDQDVAKSAVDHLYPFLEGSLICETNAGLGLISSQLLDRGVPLIRLYETCPEFRSSLKDFNNVYPGRIELFSKDVFQLHRMSHVDKMDRGNRVEQMLKGVRRKDWHDDVTMTIIGAMSNAHFLRYFTRMLAMQTEILSKGRVQLLTFIKPEEYITLTAGPHLNLHTYQRRSVLFHLFYEHTLLDKYPRKAFLPWESDRKIGLWTRYAKRIDTDSVYLVRISCKRTLPVDSSLLLPLYYFVLQFFGRGTNRVIPTLEKWIPGCGPKLIAPAKKRKHYFEDLSIFTRFGELTPQQILLIFLEVIANPDYHNSTFASMVEAELLKTETVPTDVHDLNVLPKTDILEEKLQE